MTTPPSQRDPTQPSGTTWLLCSVACAVVACLAVILWTDIPLGVPREWDWPRTVSGEGFGWRILAPAFASVIYFGLVWSGGYHIAVARKGVLLAWLAALWVGGFAWVWCAQQACPSGYDLGKSVWVLYYPKSSGYFTEARLQHHRMDEFLANYHDFVAKGDVLHQGTHPPGLIIAFHGIISLVERFPTLVEILESTEPENVSASFRELYSLSRNTEKGLGAGRAVVATDRAVLWLAFLLVQGAAVSTIFPLFGLLRRTVSAEVAWIATAFWPVVPALAIFIPKSDSLFPLLSTGVIWTFWQALSTRGFGAFVWGTIAGLIIWCGLMMSLAFLVAAVICGVGVLATWQPPTQDFRRDAVRSLTLHVVRQLPALIGLVVAISGLTLWFSQTFDCPLLSIWRENLGNHAGFYQQFQRTYWKWLLENPIELAIAAGLPLSVPAAISVFRAVRNRKPSFAVLTWGLTWGLLWISGKNHGEAARLWLFLMPGLCWLWGEWLEHDRVSFTLARVKNIGLILLSLQIIAALGVIFYVGGFQY